jgi:hypothetical protein
MDMGILYQYYFSVSNRCSRVRFVAEKQKSNDDKAG